MKYKLTDTLPKAGKLQLKHPVTGEAMEGAVLFVVGLDSKQYAEAQLAQAKANFKNGKLVEDLDVISESALDVYCSLVTGWEGGEDGFFCVEATPAAIRAVVRHPELAYIRKQIDEFVAEKTNFYQASPSN